MTAVSINNSGHRGIVWDKQPLGDVPDVRLAVELGVTSAAVRKARLKRGILKYHSKRWGGVQLGVLPDSQIAEQVGISRSSVSRARRLKGLRGPQTVDWDKQPLGEVPDVALAVQLGVDPSVVGAARRGRGIPRGDLMCRTSEGEPATYPEGLIDFYWHEKGIPHHFQVRIGPYLADWVLEGNLVVEYAGFADHRKLGSSYLSRLRRKCAFYQSEGFLVQVIPPTGLSSFNLGVLPLFREKSKKCVRCDARFGIDRGLLGGILRHKAHGLCQNCYRRKPRAEA